jgi:hypothetical protein
MPRVLHGTWPVRPSDLQCDDAVPQARTTAWATQGDREIGRVGGVAVRFQQANTEYGTQRHALVGEKREMHRANDMGHDWHISSKSK